jgi:XTP/dITP diphosphohydrolase
VTRMDRPSALTPVYLASGNAHKVEEFQELVTVSALRLEIHSAGAVGGMPAVIEDSGTFVGNARKKAQALRTIVPESAWVLADDSGLCVDALGGAPGVESAYFAGPAGDSAANLRHLVEVMRDVPVGQRGGHFQCILVLLAPDGAEAVFEGRVGGALALEPRGGAGFGYDPLFVPEGWRQTVAELPADVKHSLSHRGRAWQRLAEWWRTNAARA